MGIYGQDAELRLLDRLLQHLEHRTMIDVGAEQGGFARGMLEAGVERLLAIEPHPDNAAALRNRFADNPSVTIHEQAVSDSDGTGELHVSSNPDGTPVSFGHTLLQREETDEIVWKSTLPVRRRSLQSMIEAGEIPAQIGILKIDTEGHDLAVMQGMGALQADVVMVEHWTDLPQGLGICPWTTAEMAALLQDRGFTNFAFIIHRGEFVTLKWNDGEVEAGAMGNLVFIHDRVIERVLPEVLAIAGQLAERAISRAERYASAATDRIALVDELKQAADERLELAGELRHAADDRLALISELTATAAERLQALEETDASLKEREAELELLRHAADDRLALISELTAIAAERLQALETTNAALKERDAELELLRHTTST